MKTVKSILLSGAALAPLSVFAHAGHGHENPLSPGHFLGNPEHAIPLALTAAVVLYFIGKRIFQTRTKKERK